MQLRVITVQLTLGVVVVAFLAFEDSMHFFEVFSLFPGDAEDLGKAVLSL